MLWGVGLSALAAVIGALWWGGPGAIAAGGFGLVATVIQVIATRRVLALGKTSFDQFVKQWGVGMGLRIGGVVLLVVAVLVDRTLFPPLPAAVGYLGVLIPLMGLEVRIVGEGTPDSRTPD